METVYCGGSTGLIFALWLLRKEWGPNNPFKVKTKLPPITSKLLTVPPFPNNTTGLEELGGGGSQNKTVKQKHRTFSFSL